MTVDCFGFGARRAPLQLHRRFARGFFEHFLHATRAPARACFPREDADGEPDQTEGDEMIARERFVIKKNAEKERSGRRQILKEAEGRKSKMTRGVSKPEKGHGGDDAGADQ